MKPIKAKNRCNKCAYEWEDWSGTLADLSSCPSCFSLYWTWLNRDEWKKKPK